MHADMRACGHWTGDAPLQQLDMSVATVDHALEEVRPYLMADGGNVTVVSVDSGVVYLRLEVRPKRHAAGALLLLVGKLLDFLFSFLFFLLD